jgi:hypothetical protein
MSLHQDPHPMSGKTVRVKLASASFDTPYVRLEDGAAYRVEDWWDRVAGKSWMDSDGNLAALGYAIRCAGTNLPAFDDEVVYGKVGNFGFLLHAFELGEVLP